MAEFTQCTTCDEPEACEIVSRCLEPQLDSAWQGCWNLLSTKEDQRG